MSTLFLAACCLAGSSQDVESFVAGLLEQYPQARLLDVYKSCFQDYMGAEHLVGNTESARGYLEQELSTTCADDLLPRLSEPCGPSGNYIRVSLLAVHKGYITADKLLDCFVASANSERPSVDQWAQRWHEIIVVIERMKLTLPHYDEDKQFIEQVLSKGNYAISHSAEYREAYSPHYRIIRRDIYETELKPLLPSDYQ